MFRPAPVSIPPVETPSPLPPGVGIPPGVTPLAHLAAVIEAERAKLEARPPLVLTHRTPDPDALGAMLGLERLLSGHFGLAPEIAATGRISRAENVAMLRELELSFADSEHLERGRHGGVFLVDTQPGFGHTTLPRGLPVLAVFDHHRPPDLAAIRGGPLPPHYDLRLEAGSTSALVYGYLRDARIELDTRTATALCCGVRFDTLDLAVSATALDTEAFFETFRRADHQKLARIQRPTLPPVYYRDLYRSLSRARRYGPAVLGFLGRVSNPESVAEMADFFRRMEACRWSLVGGAAGATYHLSLRTDGVEAYPLLAHVLAKEGSFGGRGTVAGGQIALASDDWRELHRLERRLRSRALELVDPAERTGGRGTRLTEIP